MTDFPRISLEDTYNLVQLARDAALAQGRKAQAARLEPVAEEIASLLSSKQQAARTTPAKPASDLAGQPGFQTLLDLSRKDTAQPTAHRSLVEDPGERNRVVLAMTAAGMPDLEVARQLGLTRAEVNLIVDAASKGQR